MSYSTIDYILTSSSKFVIDFAVIDPDVNFSDHLPLMSTFNVIAQTNRPSVNNNANQAVPTHKQLRWDRANLESYNKLSGDLLVPLLEKVNFFVANSSQLSLLDSNLIIDQLFTETCNALVGCADEFVPHCRKKNLNFGGTKSLNC